MIANRNVNLYSRKEDEMINLRKLVAWTLFYILLDYKKRMEKERNALIPTIFCAKPDCVDISRPQPNLLIRKMLFSSFGSRTSTMLAKSGVYLCLLESQNVKQFADVCAIKSHTQRVVHRKLCHRRFCTIV